MSRPLPEGKLIAFYGDDFTGSSSVMEILTFAGLKTVLFLDAPSENQLKNFNDAHCIGIAGVARSRSPEWMNEHLSRFYAALKSFNAPIVHYKTCSTFDSSLTLGSIGRAIDIYEAKKWIPLMVAAPEIGRYQAFGNLFARVAGVTHRLDRHPVMAHHPITPMDEADLRKHLSRQTDKKIGLIDLVALKQKRGAEALQNELHNGKVIISLDTIDNESLIEAGKLMWEHGDGFAVGSQGVEYALVAYWQAEGLLPPSPPLPKVEKLNQIACISGSLSPITAEQINMAQPNGFKLIKLNVTNPLWEETFETALLAVSEGQSPLIHTAIGHADATKLTATQNDQIGAGLGNLLNRLMSKTSLKRGCVAGGDTSGHAVTKMGVFALEAIASIEAGAPLCKAYSNQGNFEIVMKGGQIGSPQFFSNVRDGQK